MSGPLHQFEIIKLVPMDIGGVDISLTNSAAHMLGVIGFVLVLMFMSISARALVPARFQALSELFYDFMTSMVRDNAGAGARKFFPFVFSLFMLILFGNALGMLPGAFTFTSHIIVTFTLALIVFLTVTLLALFKHGLHFFTFFVPAGTSVFLAPIIIPIEIISYLSRPISLSIRLFANMMAGHTMLKVFAGFSVTLGAAFGGLGYAMGILPVVINIGLVGFEFMVAFLQAYVFTILTCLYIRDAIELH